MQLKLYPKRQRQNRVLKVAAQMPPLHHKPPDQDFDIMRSEAAQWLVNQPEIRLFVFDLAYRRGAIRFEKGLWQGVIQRLAKP